MLLLRLTMSANHFSGCGCCTFPGPLWGYLFWKFCFLVGKLCLGQITFGPLPHCSKIHHRDYIERIPFNAQMGGAWQTFDGDSRVCSHCTSPESIVQTQYGMKTSPCIPDVRWPGTVLQTKIPVPPWEPVLSFLCVTSNWSRLIQTTLGCATCCTWFDHSWWSCISRLTFHKWHWSWKCCCSQLLPWVHPSHPALYWSWWKQIIPM